MNAIALVLVAVPKYCTRRRRVGTLAQGNVAAHGNGASKCRRRSLQEHIKGLSFGVPC